MKKISVAKPTVAAKAGAFLLCLVLGSTCFWTGFVALFHWNDIWLGGSYEQSLAAEQDAREDYAWIQALLELKQKELWVGSLTYSEQEQVKNLESTYTSDKSNFRFQVHDQMGTPILSNLDGKTLEETTQKQYMRTVPLTYGMDFFEKDYNILYDEERELYQRMVYTDEGYVACDPKARPGEYNAYGWLSDGQGWWEYSSVYDTRIRSREVVVEYGIASPMTVQDRYATNKESFDSMQRFLPLVAVGALLTLVGTAALLVFLCSSAGRREDGITVPGWQERIPFDVYVVLDGFLFTALVGGVDAVTYSSNLGLNRLVVVGLGVFTLLFATLALGLMLTTVTRIKTHTRNALLRQGWRAMVRGVRGALHGLPITWRLICLFLLYLLGTLLTAVTLVLIPLYQGFVLWGLCRWQRQWRAIRQGTERILGGEPDFKINSKGMYRPLKQHAEQLNDLGRAIGSAVDEQLRSERFKAELITNVSHDLKTPLTSIINYVGLLKAMPIEHPQALAYIDVLDRKSQRLKKLTEDLVDASKASTGNLSVTLERLGMGQLVQQALGEYEERFSAQSLAVVFLPPADELYVWADGRHLWRVIDNLFSNCAKYAMEHTRIYLELRRLDGGIQLSVKNISRQALNVPPEQLMERFVRGEESRTAEGSGLGLSIARSLTEIQHGSFRLEIDGDLFKASISFPEALALPEKLPQEEGNFKAGSV